MRDCKGGATSYKELTHCWQPGELPQPQGWCESCVLNMQLKVAVGCHWACFPCVGVGGCNAEPHVGLAPGNEFSASPSLLVEWPCKSKHRWGKALDGGRRWHRVFQQQHTAMSPQWTQNHSYCQLSARNYHPRVEKRNPGCIFPAALDM